MTGSLVAVIIGAALIICGAALLILQLGTKRKFGRDNSIESEIMNPGIILLGIGVVLILSGLLMSGPHPNYGGRGGQ